MKVISLQSGSNGNCTYVEAGATRLLFDAGISGSVAAERLAARGIPMSDVQGLIISHDHRDHCRCLGVYHRKFGLPVHITRGTLSVAAAKEKLGTLRDVRFFAAGAALRFGNVTVETIPTPHDAADGVAFVVDDGTTRVGILTDLGHVFEGLLPVVGSLDAVLLESNYDPDMLAHGPYPEPLQRRIRSPQGHLSNREAAELLRDGASSRLKWACLAHLSEENNHPGLALETHRQVLGSRFPLRVASRYEATEVLEV